MIDVFKYSIINLSMLYTVGSTFQHITSSSALFTSLIKSQPHMYACVLLTYRICYELPLLSKKEEKMMVSYGISYTMVSYGISYTPILGSVMSSTRLAKRKLYNRLFFSCRIISTVPCSFVSVLQSIGLFK